MGNLFERVNALNAKIEEDFKKETILAINDQRFVEYMKSSGNKDAMSEVTYYTCLKILSETMGKMPLKYYRMEGESRVRAEPTPASIIITQKPNPYHTPLMMKTFLELCCQNYGNAFCYIERAEARTGGRILETVRGLWPLDPNKVQVMYDNKGIMGDVDGNRIWYQYDDPCAGTMFIPARNMIHLRTWLLKSDGIMGMSAREILKETFSGATEAQDVMNTQYKSGLTASMAMQYTGDFDKEKVEKLRKKFADKLTGSKNAGAVVPVPIGLQLTPLNSSMQSSQFAELRRYTALQIAAAFGIKPTQINDYEKASYASSEAQQIDFLQNTMLYRITAWEEEINSKLLTDDDRKGQCFYKFNEKVLLRTDSKTQSEIMRNEVLSAIRKSNEARRMIDLPDDEHGDQLMINGSYIPLSMLGQQYVKKGGE